MLIGVFPSGTSLWRILSSDGWMMIWNGHKGPSWMDDALESSRLPHLHVLATLGCSVFPFGTSHMTGLQRLPRRY